jgi:hypothetical protein
MYDVYNVGLVKPEHSGKEDILYSREDRGIELKCNRYNCDTTVRVEGMAA